MKISGLPLRPSRILRRQATYFVPRTVTDRSSVTTGIASCTVAGDPESCSLIVRRSGRRRRVVRCRTPSWWPRLRFAGIRTPKRRVLRLMREHGLLAPSRTGGPWGPRSPTEQSLPNASIRCGALIWTTAVIGEGQAAMFVDVDP